MANTYNEFKVVFNGNEIIEKKQTKRGSVRVSQQTANTNNLYTHSTGLLYELVEEKAEKTPERVALEDKAKDLGIKHHVNISDAKLIEKIEAIETK